MARIPLGITSDAPGNYQTRLNNREKKVLETLREERNVNLTFKNQPVYSSMTAAGTVVPTEATAADVIPMTLDGESAELHLSVVETTGTALYACPNVASANTLSCPLDADVTDGPTAQEITFGVTSGSKCAYTVGSFPQAKTIMLEATIAVADVSDLDQFFFGWRKAEAYQAEPDNYDEMAAFHVGETGATVDDGYISIATILNGAATTYTPTTETDWADTGSHTLKIEVDNDGTCRFYYDGAEPTATATFSFDSGEVIVPFFFYENTSGSTTGDPTITVSALKCGTK